MHFFQRTLLIVASLLVMLYNPNHAVAQPDTSSDETITPIGTWEGQLKIPNGSLRLVFHIKSDDQGGLTSTIDSPDQGATGIPVTTTTFKDGMLVMAATAIAGTYEGTLSDDDQSLNGEWSQGGMSFPLNMELTEAPTQLLRPQEPKPPFPYDNEEVTFENPEANLQLAGTLTTPSTAGPHPAVILISGSGPQNRDEALMGHKPFLVLSDYLTRRGIAVLRYDDRGVGESTGNFTTATSKDLATDVQAAINFLKTHSKIDAAKIGLAGHSEGGLIAPMLANDPNNVSFIVMLAGPGLTGHEILITQNKLIAEASGMSSDLIEKALYVNSSLYKVFMENEEEDLKDTFDNEWAAIKKEIGGETATALGLTAGRDQQIYQQLSSPWFRYFLSYDPIPALKRVQVPVLSIIGEKDLQVSAEENTKAIREALESVNHPQFRAEILGGLNHLFQTAETGLMTEYSTIEETFAPLALEIIGDWIWQQINP